MYDGFRVLHIEPCVLYEHGVTVNYLMAIPFLHILLELS